MRALFKISFFVLPIFLVTPKLHADELAEQREEVPHELNFWLRDATMSRIEVPFMLGSLYGDHMEQSFLFGSGLYFRLIPPLTIGVDLGYTNLDYDPNSAFGQQINNDNAYSIDGVLRFSLPGAYRERKKTKEIDFYTVLGGGVVRISDSFRGSGFIGVGIKIYTKWDWLSTRIEMRNRFMTVSTTVGSRFENNLMLMVGPILQLPPYIN